MRLHHLGKSPVVRGPVVRGMFGKAALATAALSGLLFFAGAPSAKAADRDDDHRRVAKSERRFSDEDRGYYTRQADNWREERREAVERRDRDYHNDWDRDREYNRDYNRYHRDRDRD